MIALVFALLASPLSQADNTPYVAHYEVPVSAELAPYAGFDVGYSATTDAKGVTTLSYTLPATLLGADRTFTLSGAIDPKAPSFALHGLDADMNCTSGTNENVQCQVAHHAVAIDLAGVQTALNSTSLSPQEKDGKFAVASFVARMGGDLVGVLTYPRALMEAPEIK